MQTRHKINTRPIMLQSRQKLSSNESLAYFTKNTRHTRKLAHRISPLITTLALDTVGMSSRRSKRAQQRIQSVAHVNWITLNCPMLLIALVVCSISLVMFAPLSSQANASTQVSNSNHISLQNHQVPSRHSSNSDLNTPEDRWNFHVYPQTKRRCHNLLYRRPISFSFWTTCLAPLQAETFNRFVQISRKWSV